jgi:ubiquinone/menaquinone biosynthesis C-methylase UbiE
LPQTILLLACTAGAAWTQVAEEANRGYETSEDRSRVAQNLDNADREDSQKPRELLAALGVSKGDTVADIGTGVGFMLPYLAEAVGPTGRVFAEDIFPDFLEKAQGKIDEHGWKNVTTVLGGEKDAKLPQGAVDLALILDVYHHFNYPAEVLASLRNSLKPDGRLVVVDFYRSRKHPRMSPDRLENHIRLDRDGFAAEIESAGFQLDRQFDHLPHQYVLVFKKK